MLTACPRLMPFGKDVFALFLLLALCACSRSHGDVAEVIQQNTLANGGSAAIESIRSIEIALHIVDPGFEVDATYWAARPGKMRIDISSGGKHVFTEAFNGQRGWEWPGKGDPVDCSPKATDALRHGVELPGKIFGLHEMEGRGHRIVRSADEQVDSANYHVLHLTMADGYSTVLYVDAQSGLITRRRDVRPLHVDIDPTPTTIEAKTSDFRRVNDVMFGFLMTDTDLKTGKILETATVRSIKINPPIEDSFFERL